ncbi:unnamed protein product, partial [Effrenium voratum]
MEKGDPEGHHLGFTNLANVRHDKPRVPEEPTLAVPHEPVLSEKFQRVLQMLVQEHVSEVNFLECELRDLRRKEPAAQPAQKDNLQDYRSEYVFQNETPGVCFEELDPESAASSQSAQSWQSQTAGLDHKLRKQHTVTEVLRRQHEAMPHVEASRILESLEGLQGVQEPRIFTTEAMPGLLSDTPSEFIRRYQGLSRFQKLQMFLQSHQFEMIIFFVLCLNV